MTAIDDDHPDAGPQYDVDSATLKKFRRKAKSLKDLPPDERKAYGAAVEDAVLSKQRSALARVTSSPRSNSASGTFHNDGGAIIKAVIQQQRAALAAAPAQIRRARTPDEWRKMYDEAMRERWGQRWDGEKVT